MKEIQLTKLSLIALGTICLAALSGCTFVLPLPPLPPATVTPLPPKQEDPDAPVDFVKHIKPIFEYRCVRCHSSETAHAGLDLQNPIAVFEARQMIIPGDAANSRLYRSVSRPGNHPKTMPDDGWGLTKTHQRQLREWIDKGAEWPQGQAGQLQDKKFSTGG